MAVSVQLATSTYEDATFGVAGPLPEAVAMLDEELETLTIFAVNRKQDGPLPLEGNLRALPGSASSGISRWSARTRMQGTRSRRRPPSCWALTATLPALSWYAIRLARSAA